MKDVSLWRAGPLAALWTDGSSTDVSLDPGEPIRVCVDGVHDAFAGIVIEAPVRIESADGKIALDETLPFFFYPGEQGTAMAGTNWVRRLWLPVGEFEQLTGVKGVNFGGAELGGVYVHNQFELVANTASGGLTIHKWENDDAVPAGYPSLSW